jgi:hypothetical protein
MTATMIFIGIAATAVVLGALFVWIYSLFTQKHARHVRADYVAASKKSRDQVWGERAGARPVR